MPIAVDRPIPRFAIFEAAPPPPSPPPPSPPPVPAPAPTSPSLAAAGCSSSSIGKDSDDCLSPASEEGEEGEVQSKYREPLSGLEALEESLPIRRGISKFYNGKSRSFTVLRDSISPSASAKDLAKAENAYTRKRKNLLAYSIMYDKRQDTVPVAEEGISPKRLTNLSRSTLRPFASDSSRSSSSSISSEENEPHQQHDLPPPQENSPTSTVPTFWLGSCAQKTSSMHMRSFSMMDLHRLHRSSPSVLLKDKQKAD